MASPKLEPLVLADDERQVLEGWARRRKTAQALALRSRIILACADGAGVSAVAAELGIARTTAGKWRSRFLEARLQGLSDGGFRRHRNRAAGSLVGAEIGSTAWKQPTEGVYRHLRLKQERAAAG